MSSDLISLPNEEKEGDDVLFQTALDEFHSILPEFTSSLQNSSSSITQPSSCIPSHSCENHGILTNCSADISVVSETSLSDTEVIQEKQMPQNLPPLDSSTILGKSEVPVSTNASLVVRRRSIQRHEDPVSLHSWSRTEQSDPSTTTINTLSTNPLVSLAELMIRAILFQISLLVSFVTFPLRALRCSLSLLINPLESLNWVRYIFQKLLLVCTRTGVFMYEQLESQLGAGGSLRLFGLGCIWTSSICVFLSGTFVVALVSSAFIVNWSVEEPIKLDEALYFDYTKPNPVAFVPILSCDVAVAHDGIKMNPILEKLHKARPIPPKHKVQAVVVLNLPESDHNRRLGVFQVKVDLLSLNGKVTASTNHPCMLHFKSSTIRYMETLIKSGPLLAGYASESQTLSLKMTTFTEGYEPTACVKVTLEQRAEFKPGTGVPEVYSSVFLLETELPFFKRIIWKWKKTIFIWFAMWIFVVQLLFLLICCRMVILPSQRPGRGSVSSWWARS